MNKSLNPRKKITIVLLLIFLFGIGGLFIKNKFAKDTHFYQSLNKQIRLGSHQISIASLTNFDWEKVYFIGSYNGFKDKENNTCSSGDYDGAWSLAFTKNDVLAQCIQGKKLSFDRSLKSNTFFSRNSLLVINDKIFNIKED